MTQDVPSPDERGSFLQRWSKRKLEEKSTAVQPVGNEPVAVEHPAEEEPFDISTLPTLDEITGDSDLSVFLQKGVPQALKNAAMRRVWALDPQISAISGPLDYAWDFNDPNGVPGFGPLAADFDPTEMLKRIMGESEPELDAEEAQNTFASDEIIKAEDVADLPSSDAKVADISAGSPSLLQNSEISPSPADDGNDGITLVFPDVTGNSSSDEGPRPQMSQGLLPRKRHGGAVPI